MTVDCMMQMAQGKSLIELSNEEVVAVVSIANRLRLPQAVGDSAPTGAQHSEWDRYFILQWIQGRMGLEDGAMVEFQTAPSYL